MQISPPCWTPTVALHINQHTPELLKIPPHTHADAPHRHPGRRCRPVPWTAPASGPQPSAEARRGSRQVKHTSERTSQRRAHTPRNRGNAMLTSALGMLRLTAHPIPPEELLLKSQELGGSKVMVCLCCGGICGDSEIH